jgi:hypothetical protein
MIQDNQAGGVKLEALPCPFCGGYAHTVSGGPGNHFVRCSVCRASSDDMSRDRAIAAWNRRAALPAAGATEPTVTTREMKLSPGVDGEPRSDFFVSIRVGDREVTPHVFRDRYKTEYHVALYDWLLNGGDEPELMEFGPDEWPARQIGNPLFASPLKPSEAEVVHAALNRMNPDCVTLDMVRAALSGGAK